MKFARRLVVAATAACLPLACSVALASGDIVAPASSGRVAVDPVLHRAFVAQRDQGRIALIDLPRGAVVDSVDAGFAPVAVISNAATSRLYVLNDGSPGVLRVLDSASGTTLASIDMGLHPNGLAADFGRAEIYVTNSGDASLSVIDVNTNRRVADIPVGSGPVGVAVDRARGLVYVANALEGTVKAIDQSLRAVVATSNAGQNPGTPVVETLSGRVLVPSLDGNVLTIFEAGLARLAGALPIGEGSTAGALSGAYRQYAIPSATARTLTLVDLETLGSLTIGAVGTQPTVATFDEDRGTLFVASLGSTTVTLVDPRDAAVRDVFDIALQRPKTEAVAVSDGVFVRLETDGSLASPPVMTVPGLRGDTAIAAEYVDADLGLFFNTSDATEKRLLDDGLYGGAWQRTESYFRVWTTPGTGRVPVCRFFDFANAPRTLHGFFSGDDCAAGLASDTWSYEKIAYFVAAPQDGACPDGTDPLYRLFREHAPGAPAYRYTGSIAQREAMLAEGWIDQPADQGAPFACTPTLGRMAIPLEVHVPAKPYPPGNGRIPMRGRGR